ncbi:hypothetical protein SAMN05216464_12023 [Mucilaginibacter pineti]|uniref:Uncharacterized protein n=1 Tax=Mucilaginibacter pineti TaxID=1391627 RepID=A0A1G7M0L7_9SPHI|nr:hypothetical protein [Mucilaginibacter pineti]SDF55345.1 hypothetical protein SAMN05216464_12023 [Mucilaginibacter pineti]
MKKIAVVLLILIYSASVYGVTIRRFYCCGKLADVPVNASFKSGGKAVGSACCKNIKINFNIKDNHFLAKNDLTLKAPVALITPAFFISASPERISLNEISAYNSQAPPAPLYPLYILYSNYRI